MRKLKERFHRKHGVVSRIFSMVLALAMIMTMAPAIGGATTAYAASPTIRLYLDKPSTWNTPVVNVWAAGATVDNHDAGNATISQWGDQEKPKLAYEESSGLYYVDVQSSEWTGFQFVDAGSTEKAAPEIKTEGAAIEQIKTLLLIQAFIVYWMAMENISGIRMLQRRKHWFRSLYQQNVI